MWELLSAESMRRVKRNRSYDTPVVAACHEDWGGRRSFWSKWLRQIAHVPKGQPFTSPGPSAQVHVPKNQQKAQRVGNSLSVIQIYTIRMF